MPSHAGTRILSSLSTAAPLGQGQPWGPTGTQLPAWELHGGWRKEKQGPEGVCLCVLFYLKQCRALMLRVYVLASPQCSLFLPLCFLLWHHSCSSEYTPGGLVLSRSLGKLSDASREQRRGLRVRGQAKLLSFAFLLGTPLPLPSQKRLRGLSGDLSKERTAGELLLLVQGTLRATLRIVCLRKAGTVGLLPSRKTRAALKTPGRLKPARTPR